MDALMGFDGADTAGKGSCGGVTGEALTGVSTTNAFVSTACTDAFFTLGATQWIAGFSVFRADGDNTTRPVENPITTALTNVAAIVALAPTLADAPSAAPLATTAEVVSAPAASPLTRRFLPRWRAGNGAVSASAAKSSI
jgi:hypothetical protein